MSCSEKNFISLLTVKYLDIIKVTTSGSRFNIDVCDNDVHNILGVVGVKDPATVSVARKRNEEQSGVYNNQLFISFVTFT